MENKKVCTKCNIEKNYSSFHKHKLGIYGLRPKCKLCRKNENLKYHQSKEGLMTKMMASMKNSSKKRNMSLPEFDKNSFKSWVLAQEVFHKLYYEYEQSNYSTRLKPSIDRLDDYKGYSFDNMQIITWGENYDKSRLHMVDGTNTKNSKTVYQYTKEGELVREYFSMAEAAKHLNTNWQNISACCRGVHKTCKGYIFSYHNSSKLKK